MNLTLLTCTSDRPEAFALTEKYVARQSTPYHQWIVMDDGTTPVTPTMGQQYIYCPHLRGPQSMVKKVKEVMAAKLIVGDALVFIEDDDYLHQDWLAFCVKNLQNLDLVGEGRAIYYNVQQRYWFEHANLQHASLCSTAIKRSLFPVLEKVCNSINHAFIDDPLWKAAPINRKKVFDPGRTSRLVVGIKAMPGKKGYGSGHVGRDKAAQADPEMKKLRALIGEDADNYAGFYGPVAAVTPEPAAPSAPVNIAKSDCGRAHGPNWLKWLGHLAGKPGIAGLEIGTWKGESAEWMLDNICTAPDSRFFCIDPFTGSQEHWDRKMDCSMLETESRARLAKYPNVTILKEYSQKALMKWEGPRLMWGYVDGDHTAAAALRDAALLFELLEPGGIIIWDDYLWDAMSRPIDRPKIGVDAFLAAYADKIEVLSPRGWQVAVRKK